MFLFVRLFTQFLIYDFFHRPLRISWWLKSKPNRFFLIRTFRTPQKCWKNVSLSYYKVVDGFFRVPSRTPSSAYTFKKLSINNFVPCGRAELPRLPPQFDRIPDKRPAWRPAPRLAGPSIPFGPTADPNWKTATNEVYDLFCSRVRLAEISRSLSFCSFALCCGPLLWNRFVVLRINHQLPYHHTLTTTVSNVHKIQFAVQQPRVHQHSAYFL